MLLFFLIAFGVPWAGWTGLAITGVQLPSPLAWALFLTGDFCSVAGFVATYREGGLPGLKDLVRRSVRFRVPLVWWLYALFLPVLWAAVATVIYGLGHAGIGAVKPLAVFKLFTPPLLFWFITGPLGEEFGWRGFLLPRLLQKYSPLAASVILGVIWTVWHYPLYYNTVFASAFRAVNFVAGVLCSSVLITLLFLHTRQSVLLPIVFHWSVNQAPGVVREIFPQVRAATQQSFDLVQLPVLLGLTLLLMVGFGAVRLRRSTSPPGVAAATPS